ncbi:hypothetical protein ABFS83_08G100400 [Erythranthe nasuta]
METPSSSTRRVTRSQTSAASANLQFSKEKGRERSGKKEGKQEERCALIDITNDSPIVGLAIGNLKTPSSSSCSSYSTRKGKSIIGVGTTPGSGEALLRGQVKTLLQKVEEEAEVLVNNNTRRPPSFFINLIKSPNNHIVGAPTPANTPQILFSVDDALSLPPCLTSSPVQDNFLLLPPQKEEGIDDECEKKKNNVITRSLLLDFSENEGGKGCSDDDNESVWSIQVNASENQQEEEEEYYEYYEDEEEEEEDGFCGNLLSVLCEGMSNISVVDNEAPKFEVGGKHIRFIYDSDDEMIIEGGDDDSVVSSQDK